MFKKISQFIKHQKQLKRHRCIREHTIGRFIIQLPPNHRLDVFQSACPRYDTSLTSILEVHAEKYPAMSVMDIGANVGDTVALIRSVNDFPTVCVDGNPEYLPWLKQNTAQMGEQIFIEPCFIGADHASVSADSISNKNGTGNISQHRNDTSQQSDIALMPLADIFDRYTHLPPFRLVKMDTDGFDFTILLSAIDVLAKHKPSLFFEYDPSLAQGGSEQSLDAIRALNKIGYNRYAVYDNFGNYLLSICGDPLDQFFDLNQFLLSSSTSKYGVDYLDIVAYHDNDSDLHQQLVARERQRKFST